MSGGPVPKTYAFIPARFASTRFPGKPLIDLKGKPMVQRVWEQACKAKGISAVYVATDDRRIATAVRAFGGDAVMTPVSCPTGTDRLAAALKKLRGVKADDIIVNVQGDEPLLPPSMVELVVKVLKQTGAPMATLARPLTQAEYLNPNNVKVLWDSKGLALYFSRAPIAYHRDKPGKLPDGLRLGLHVGLYAYRAGFLQKLTKLKPTKLEQAEKLEQLRVLDSGERIAVGFTKAVSHAIDTPGDAAKVWRLL
jgi:3-deoxy-manno-octulosonate cytidylyltransferase (CMP-KDO synthetase)